MENQLLNFIINHKDSISNDIANNFELTFEIPVNKISSIDFPIKLKNDIKYSVTYSKNTWNSLNSFIETFGDSNVIDSINELVKIVMIVEKKLLIRSSANNIAIFKENSNFLNCLDDINLQNKDEKLYVIILDITDKLKTDFIETLSIKEFYKYEFTNTSISSYDKFIQLNKLMKSSNMKSYLEYPLSWIDPSNGSQSLNVFRVWAANCFLNIIKNGELENGNKIIRGNKTVYISNNDTDLFSYESSKALGEIVDFLVDEQRSKDKLLILRNTITLFLKTEDTITGLSNNFEEISKNVDFFFNLYVKEKISIFLSLENNLINEFIDMAKKTAELINDLQNKIKEISLSLLATVFLSLIGDVKDIRQSFLLNIVIAAYIVYFSVNLFVIFQINHQYKANINILQRYMNSFKGLSKELTYENMNEDYLKESSKNFISTYRKTVGSIVFLILFFIIIFLTIRFDFQCVKNIVKIIFGYNT